MRIAPANGIEICYDTTGNPADPPLLLVMGFTAQLVAWDIDFCQMFADRGRYVIRFDNRDVGLSTHFDGQIPDAAALVPGTPRDEMPPVPYTLADMADDGFALLDHLGIQQAHIFGASMGGMIVQRMAIAHPERVLSMTSVMSTTGEREYATAKPEAAAVLVRPVAKTRDEAIANAIESSTIIGTPSEHDEERYRRRAEAAYDRCYEPAGVARQLLGITASGGRADALRALDVPTLVIHGTLDPLVSVSGGERTAELIPGAELLLIEGMGHDLPPVHWPEIIEAVTTLAGKVESNHG